MDIKLLCEEANVTLKSTYRNPSIPVDVVCNECDLRFPVVISEATKISCPACSKVDIARLIEENIVTIDPEEPSMAFDYEVEKTEDTEEY